MFLKLSEPVSAAKAYPRSGSGVELKYCSNSDSFLFLELVKIRSDSKFEKAFIIVRLFHLYVEEKVAQLEFRFFRTNISEHLLFRVLSKLFLHQSV